MKIAIIGANEFQNKLVKKAKTLGIETHVFAWEEGAIAKENSSYFYPVSITEKDKILEICKKNKIDGICSVGSDLAVLTVNYIAEKLNLVGNTLNSTLLSTNKYEMRKKLSKDGLPCPKFLLLENFERKFIEGQEISYPVIVKPTDRSGSRGIYKVEKKDEIYEACLKAKKESFNQRILIEEYIEGNEYSVESISIEGEHKILQITKKFTNGSPNFIETGHLQPAILNDKIKGGIENIIKRALDSLEIKNGASHSEIKILDNEIKIIEIGARMGGDFIGSDLVELSTGIDYLKLVLEIALGKKIDLNKIIAKYENISAVKFFFDENDIKRFENIEKKYKENIKEIFIKNNFEKVTDSSNRNGYCILKFNKNFDRNKLEEVLK